MIYDLILHTVEKYGGDSSLAKRLIVYGDKQYITWVVRNVIDGEHVNRGIESLSIVLDTPMSRIKYAYFSAKATPIIDIAKRSEYSRVMNLVLEVSDLTKLWTSLTPYCYRQMVYIAIERMVENDETVFAISDELNISQSLVYKIRRSYLKRIINENL